MTPEDFVYKQVFNGAINGGAKQSISTACANQALTEYKQGKLNGKRVSHLIESKIKQAIQESKR